MVYPESFRGFQIEDPKKWTEFHLNDLKPKPFDDYDVDIKILACGVCASDLHTLTGGWGEQKFPLCVGHGDLQPLYALLTLCSHERRDRWHCCPSWSKSHADQAGAASGSRRSVLFLSTM